MVVFFGVAQTRTPWSLRRGRRIRIRETVRKNRDTIAKPTGRDEWREGGYYSIHHLAAMRRVSLSLLRGVGRPLRGRAKESTGVVEAYTDGSCRGAGGKDAVAGYAVYFGEGDPRNERGLIPSPPFDSLRSELYAVMRALRAFERTREKGDATLRVYCDSTEAIRHSKAKRLSRKNRDILVPIARMLREAEGRVELLWVRSHSGVEGNERAHEMASSVTRAVRGCGCDGLVAHETRREGNK